MFFAACFAVLAAVPCVSDMRGQSPVSVRVRQTPGGPRIFVDGKPIPLEKRGKEGSDPSV